jgi:hypothetical protein
VVLTFSRYSPPGSRATRAPARQRFLSPGTAPRSRVLYSIAQHGEQNRGRETMRNDPWTAANRDKEQKKVTISPRRRPTAETASPPTKPTVSGPFWTGKKSAPDVRKPQGVVDGDNDQMMIERGARRAIWLAGGPISANRASHATTSNYHVQQVFCSVRPKGRLRPKAVARAVPRLPAFGWARRSRGSASPIGHLFAFSYC